MPSIRRPKLQSITTQIERPFQSRNPHLNQFITLSHSWLFHIIRPHSQDRYLSRD